jgi:Bacterial antitoxin of type II TA system, VapB
MRTTIQLNEDLLERAKKRAADESRTLTSLVEEALTIILSSPHGERGEWIDLLVSKASGGVIPGVNPIKFLPTP